MPQTKRWKLFTFLGQSVYLEIWFLVLILLFMAPLSSAAQLPSMLLWLPILFFGILIHEYGHALAIKQLGFGDSTIILQGLGGVTINQRRSMAKPMRSIYISAAGPAFSLALALGFSAAFLLYEGAFTLPGWLQIGFLGVFTGAEYGDLLSEFFYKMAALNGFWFLFNMLPISPMDGGHIMESTLELIMKNRSKAMLTAAYISMVMLVLFCIAALTFTGFGILTVILAFLFGHHNYKTIQTYKNRRY